MTGNQGNFTERALTHGTGQEKAMLRLAGVNSCYGSSQVLFNIDMAIGPGEVVALMGRNGMGKTTTIRSVMGLAGVTSGRILFKDRDITRLPTFSIARMGIGLVPEGRQIFSRLTVAENLIATARSGASDVSWSLERVYDLFPVLKERSHHLGCDISGGEQQMLAMGRALMTNPDLLILDEATEGLAPLVRTRIWDCLETIRQSNLSILIVDKNIAKVSAICDKLYLIQKGRIVWHGNPRGINPDSREIRECLGV